MDNYIGMKLDGRYELLELIGAGGMAEIYKADDTVENKTVAVKILKNEFAASSEFLRRFRNESKAIALLSHPNIVKIFDVGGGANESVQFIVMEYIDGITLTEYIERQGVLKWREALDYVGQILKALQHAHDRGIVHRDVKSQNVMLLRDGTIKVMDFGIARFNREIDKTMSEKAIGSVHYISPEQARGDITDEKSDLYSVGVMMYETLTGVKPFDGDDALAIALMHTNKKPKPPREIAPSIPEGLEEITLRAMQKDPTQRYQTAGEMMTDLNEFGKNPGIIFEYKYYTPDGGIKHFSKTGQPTVNSTTAPVPNIAAMKMKPQNKPAVPDYDDDDDEYEDDDVIERRSPLLPILFAVASAFVIIAGVLIVSILLDTIGGEGNLMPNIVGLTMDEVEGEFPWLRLVPDFKNHDSIARNTIIEQGFAADTRLPRNNPQVDVVVSRGRQIDFMPDFTRNPWHGDDVEAELRRLGFNPRKIQVHDPEVPVDFFISSDRDPGDEIGVGEEVRFRVSLGPDRGNMSMVPDFVGMTKERAEEAANEEKLILASFQYSPSSPDLKDKVMEQDFEKGTLLPNFNPIRLTIGTGEEEEDPETRVRSTTILFSFPEGVTGSYHFKVHRNGVFLSDSSISPIINVALQRHISLPIEDYGRQAYSVIIVNTANNLEAIYCNYEIDFRHDPPFHHDEEGFVNTNVLAQLNPVITTAATTETTETLADTPAETDPDLH
jgi:serine/threonine-protein kinase